jgi:predicted secreted protein
MKRSSWVVFALSLQATAAFSADGAKFRAIGFSPDSKFFAFEQYGVQDGSGFAYSDVFILDIEKDDWLKGTPVKVLLEDETLDVSKVRAKAKADTAKLLAQADITVDPEVLAATPFTEVVQDRRKLTFHNHFNYSMGLFGDSDAQGNWTLTISDVQVPLNDGCEADLGFFGYKLELKNNKSGQTTLLHLDKQVPKSRNCPAGYDLEAVVQPAGTVDVGQLVAIIGVYPRGFEGADRRYIAVPFTFN